jgi:hypothetical protein
VQNRWLNHQVIGAIGPSQNCHTDDPLLLHLYLLSYKHHLLMCYTVITMTLLPFRVHSALQKQVSFNKSIPVLAPTP